MEAILTTKQEKRYNKLCREIEAMPDNLCFPRVRFKKLYKCLVNIIVNASKIHNADIDKKLPTMEIIEEAENIMKLALDKEP